MSSSSNSVQGKRRMLAGTIAVCAVVICLHAIAHWWTQNEFILYIPLTFIAIGLGILIASIIGQLLLLGFLQLFGDKFPKQSDDDLERDAIGAHTSPGFTDDAAFIGAAAAIGFLSTDWRGKLCVVLWVVIAAFLVYDAIEFGRWAGWM